MEDTSAQAKEYSRQKIRLSIYKLLLTILLLIVILLSGASLFLRGVVVNWTQNFYIQAGLYLVVFSLVYDLLFLGLDYYGGFLLEHKFRLSNQTILDWVKQGIKKFLLSLILCIVAGEMLYVFLRHFPNNWWLLVTAGWFLLTVVLGKIAPVLIIPLFYKCNPLDNESLKKTLLDLCTTCGVGIKRVFEIKLSKETRKANAAVAGFGKNKRILLSDTLLRNYSDDEIKAVFAHELAHVCLHHVWKILVFGALVSFISFYLAYVSFNKSLDFFGFKQVYDIAAFPLLALILLLIGLIFLPLQNGFLRCLEKKADMFALGHIQNKESFISMLKKLGKQNLSDPAPGKLVRILFYTHPSISERINYASKENEKHSSTT
jgi:STE24 endopeptidase